MTRQQRRRARWDAQDARAGRPVRAPLLTTSITLLAALLMPLLAPPADTIVHTTTGVIARP